MPRPVNWICDSAISSPVVYLFVVWQIRTKRKWTILECSWKTRAPKTHYVWRGCPSLKCIHPSFIPTRIIRWGCMHVCIDVCDRMLSMSLLTEWSTDWRHDVTTPFISAVAIHYTACCSLSCNYHQQLSIRQVVDCIYKILPKYKLPCSLCRGMLMKVVVERGGVAPVTPMITANDFSLRQLCGTSSICDWNDWQHSSATSSIKKTFHCVFGTVT